MWNKSCICRDINVWLECIDQNGDVSHTLSNFKPDNLMAHLYISSLKKNSIISTWYQDASISQINFKLNKKNNECSNTRYENVFPQYVKAEHSYAASKTLRDDSNTSINVLHVPPDHSYAHDFPTQQKHKWEKIPHQNMNVAEHINSRCSGHSDAVSSEQSKLSHTHNAFNASENVLATEHTYASLSTKIKEKKYFKSEYLKKKPSASRNSKKQKTWHFWTCRKSLQTIWSAI